MSHFPEHFTTPTRPTESVENLQLYLMQISQHMRDLIRHMDALGRITITLNERITKLEQSQKPH